VSDTTVLTWVHGLDIAPDVPHVVEWSSWLAEDLVAKDVGRKMQSPPATITTNLPKLSQDAPVRLTFNFELIQNQSISWDAVLWQRSLYLKLPNNMVMDGSKEAFINLLEFAEDEIDCENVIVCFSKQRTDKNILMRIFMFLGFVVLNPNQKLVPDSSDEMIYMAYNIE